MLRRSKSRRGQGLTEYGLLIAMILGILVLVVPTIGLGYGYINSSVNSAINSAIGGGAPGGGNPTVTPGGGNPTPTPLGNSYRTAVLATAPVSYWRLGEASGSTVAVDAMGANDDTYINSPMLGATGLLTGDPNTAVTFGGSSYISVAGLTNWVPPAGLTVAVWAKKAVPSGAYEALIQLGVSGDGATFEVGILPAGNAYGGSIVGSVGPVITDGTPHFVVYTFDGLSPTGHERLYVDGMLVSGPNAGAFTAYPSPTVFYIASDRWGRAFNGTIDEPAIWNRVLSAAEIAGLYNAGMGQ